MRTIKLMANIAAAACLLMSVFHASAVQSADVTLRVANYGGIFTTSSKKYVADLFTQRTGIKIEYIDGNTVDHLAKLIASKGREPPYDVVYLDDNVQEQAIAAGVVDKLDPKLVPNLKYVYDSLRNAQGYGPAFVLYSVGIAYNVQKFKEAGIPDPTSWKDLWDPRLAGHVAVPDLAIAMGRDFLVAAAKLNGGDENSLERGIEKIATIKAQSYPASSATIEAQFQSGDIWVAPWVNGRAWAMIDKGFPLRYVMPAEGGYGHTAVVDLVRGSTHSKEAQAYIDYVLDPLPQLGLANDVPYGPTNKLLAPVLAAYPDLSKKFPSSPEDIAKLNVINWSVFNANYAKAVDLWNRKVISK